LVRLLLAPLLIEVSRCLPWLWSAARAGSVGRYGS